MDIKQIDIVHVIFKTHLDLGFTDLASKVVDRYMNQFIPKALDLAEQLAEQNGNEQFIWTTGSWLINHYLKTASDEKKARMEQAIRKGLIAWHGLPFTTHTELMDPPLLEYAISLGQNLDQRYGRKTIAAKMTDVPGHSRALVTHMAKAGLKYLHIGVNPAITKPSVPDVFVWKGLTGEEVIVHYAQDYGETYQLDGFNEALVFAHTGDNRGPSSSEEVRQQFKELQLRFPNAIIQASTLDRFAEQLWRWKDQLPVVEEEIGDNWIYGVASDPLKVAHFRELLRLRDKWLEEGRLVKESVEYAAFCDELLMVPEHTWGLDEKKYLPDFRNFSKLDFQQARKADTLNEQSNPRKYGYISEGARYELNHLLGDEAEETAAKRSYSFFENSWEEQRKYLRSAVQALSQDKQIEVQAALVQLLPYMKTMETSEESLLTLDTYELGRFLVAFGDDGSLIKLTDVHGKEWADEQHRIGSYRYETFGSVDYLKWFEQYTVNWLEHHSWAEPDLGKLGMEFAYPQPEHKLFAPAVSQIRRSRTAEADIVRVDLRMPSFAYTKLGAPRALAVIYTFHSEKDCVEVRFEWSGKEAYRPAEASWFAIALKVDNPNRWNLEKLGELVSPLQVVKHGNRNMHAVGKGIYYYGADGDASIQTYDAPVVCPGERRLLQFDNTFASLDGGMHFNLHNNVYGTNFRMWYEDDAVFRFELNLRSN